MNLKEFHGIGDSVRWRLSFNGVEIDGSGIERTKGKPSTVIRIWETYGDIINDIAGKTRIPCELIIACICTESSGNPDAIRTEPGYKSDESTPHKISIGLMQTLLSTARDTLQMSFDRKWLLDPYNSILAGTNYIAQQAKKTNLDPPLVAAAYNAGGVYIQNGAANRWKLRQYPIGTGKHCDRFVRFFNDIVYVFSINRYRISYSIFSILENSDNPKPRSAINNKSIEIQFSSNAKEEDVTSYSLTVLKDNLGKAGLINALISSTARDPYNQARVMFRNLEEFGVEQQRSLYKKPGNRVIDVYVKKRSEGFRKDETIIAMKDKIVEVGPTNVSRHASDPKILNVFDVAPSSIKNKVDFEKCVKNDIRIKTFLVPPKDPAYHLEIPQPKV